MHSTEKKILLEVYENFSKNHSYEHTIRLNGFDGTILANYRESCLEYPCEITPAGIEAAVKEKQR